MEQSLVRSSSIAGTVALIAKTWMAQPQQRGATEITEAAALLTQVLQLILGHWINEKKKNEKEARFLQGLSVSKEARQLTFRNQNFAHSSIELHFIFPFSWM